MPSKTPRKTQSPTGKSNRNQPPAEPPQSDSGDAAFREGLGPAPHRGKDSTDVNHTPPPDSPWLFKSAMDAAAIGIAILDVTKSPHSIIYANEAYSHLTGHSQDEIVGQPVQALLGRDSGQTGAIEFHQAIIEKKHKTVFVQNTRKDGQAFWCEISLSPIVNERGELGQYLCLVSYITDRKTSMDGVPQIQSVMERAGDAVVIWTTDGAPFYWNAAIHGLVGEGDPQTRLNPCMPNSIYAEPEAMKEIFAKLTKRLSWSGEIKVVTAQKKSHPIWLHADAILDAEDEITGLVGIHIDISHQQMAQDIHRTLGNLGEKLNKAATPHDVARLMAEAADGLFAWDAFAVVFYDDQKDTTETIMTMDTLMGRRIEFRENYTKHKTPSGLLRKALKHPSLLLDKNDIESEPSYEFFGDMSRQSESFMFATVRLPLSQITAIVTFQSYMPGAYSSYDLQSLHSMVEYCGSAMQRCLVEEERRAATSKLEILNAFSLIAISCTTPTELSGALAQELRRRFTVDSCFLEAFLPNTNIGISFGTFDTIGGRFLRVPESPTPYNWMETPYGASLFLERKPILIHRSREEIKALTPSEFWWPLNSPRSASLIFVPLVAGEKITGVLSIQSYSYFAYTEQQVDTLVAVGRQIAPVVESLLLNQQLRDRNQALRESDERFQMVCRAAHDGVYDYNPLTKQVWRNEQYCRLLQLSAADALDVGWWRRNVHPEDWPDVESSLARANTHGQDRWTRVYRLRRADGEYLKVDDRAYIGRDSEGRPIRMIGAISDITKHHR